ncbi:MAG: hypothetical protein ABIJ56_03535 [Pseudomonadota bacterium]
MQSNCSASAFLTLSPRSLPGITIVNSTRGTNLAVSSTNEGRFSFSPMTSTCRRRVSESLSLKPTLSPAPTEQGSGREPESI